MAAYIALHDVIRRVSSNKVLADRGRGCYIAFLHCAASLKPLPVSKPCFSRTAAWNLKKIGTLMSNWLKIIPLKFGYIRSSIVVDIQKRFGGSILFGHSVYIYTLYISVVGKRLGP